MRILGLSLSPHDSSAAIIEDGAVIAAIEEERLTRVRHCVDYDDSKYNLKSEAKYFDSHFLNPTTSDVVKKLGRFNKYLKLGSEHTPDRADMVIGSNLIKTEIPINDYININHHLAHAAHAFYTSPYKEAAILVIDGCGDSRRGNFDTVSLYLGRSNRLTRIETTTGKINHTTNTIIALGNSIGVLYQNASVLCNLGSFGEGKLMGLASYGIPKYLNEYKKFCVKSGAHYKIDNIGLYKHIKKAIDRSSKQADIADVAASIQALTTELVLFYAKRLQRLTGLSNLCYSGGVALNAITNTQILERAGFKRMYIPSAPGDNGISIGAALYGYHQIAGNRRIIPAGVPTVYMGINYTDNEIQRAINAYRKSIVVEKMRNDKVAVEIARLLADDNIVAWYQGASEFGPRALGNRSILASPTNVNNRNRLNSIKSRESFRPVAPVITSEKSDKHFMLPRQTADSLPYMLFAFPPLNEKIAKMIPAVIHADNTARLQTVSKTQNAKLHNLLKEFAKISKVPILINTSFNIKGEPIVETPEDAVRTFIQSSLDYLVLYNYLIKRI